ncbi:peptide ABC transporter substrate-binding protein [Halogeometricum pallidum JCM 14848]|uniref:Peptide ABC transporter substrate-binding protein n=1 Tax=Halogeometricum pallidum JCM 14848 TaxID=1227487 RepID=M0CTZ7_HALPD|nr:ABC transporter substrate-binding protein [Halogeometricum pallidum]ELZ26725.1 peptide ABC transporter substrate-binding protein [Halogeometricum pallidum JCM 14848]
MNERGGDDERNGINRRTWLKALGVAGATGLAGCSGDDGGGSTGTGSTATATDGSELGTAEGTDAAVDELPEVGGTYRTIVSSPLATMNPLYNNEQGAADVASFALDLSYGFRPGTRFFPQLYDLTTDGGNVWVASLREGLQFGGDYGEVTAEDFVYQITQLHQSEWAATADASSWPSEVNVEQTGTYEFQIELPNVNPLYPETYDPLLYPVPKALVQPFVEEENAQGLEDNPELVELQYTEGGNLGAYTLEQWNRSSRLVFTRNEEYYLREADDVPDLFGNAPYFDRVEVQVAQEQSARLGALEAGQTDTAAVPPNRVTEFDGMDGVDVYQVPQPFNEVCVYNMRDNGWNAGPGNLFRKQKFRQGLGCAVDKQSLVRGVFRDYAQVQYTWQPPWSQWYPGDEEILQFGTGELYGPEAARSRIREAVSDTDYGYDGGQLLDPSGNQVELSLYHSAGQNTERNMGQYIAQEFADNAGIQVNLQAIDGVQFVNNYWQQQVPENPDQYEWSNGPYNAGPREVTGAKPWDMAIVFALNTYPLNPTTADVFFQRDSSYNPYGYYPSWNAKELFQEARAATSQEEIQPIFTEIFKRVAEDQPMGMLAFPADTIGYSSDIVGPAENFFSGWNSAAWYRDE